jgi:hypothetical protein
MASMTAATEVLDSPCGKCHKPITLGTNITITGGEIYHADHAPRDQYRPTARDHRMAVALEAIFTDEPDSPLTFTIREEAEEPEDRYVYVLNVHGSDLVEAVLAGWRAGSRRRRFVRWLVRLARRAGTETTR